MTSDDLRKIAPVNPAPAVHPGGLEPPTFGSVDRRVKTGNATTDNHLAENTGEARSAINSAPGADIDPAHLNLLLDEDVLQSAVEKVTALIASNRIRPDDVAGLTALHTAVRDGKKGGPGR